MILTQKIGELDEYCRLHNCSIVLRRTGSSKFPGKRIGIPSKNQEYPVGQVN